MSGFLISGILFFTSVFMSVFTSSAILAASDAESEDVNAKTAIKANSTKKILFLSIIVLLKIQKSLKKIEPTRKRKSHQIQKADDLKILEI
jgi:hypothetical protein